MLFVLITFYLVLFGEQLVNFHGLEPYLWLRAAPACARGSKDRWWDTVPLILGYLGYIQSTLWLN